MPSVNKPTDPKRKEEDIARKLQLYGISSAFAQGKAPSNKQIDVALNSFLKSKYVANPPNKLSDEGKHLVADLRDVVEQAKLLLLSKNDGNLIQEFIWETQRISGGDAQAPGVDLTKDQAKQHGNEAAEGLRVLARLIVSNGQFRKLLNDAVILVRSIAGDAASKAANKVQPSQGDLEQIDRPAEENVWHDTPEFGDVKGTLKEKYQANKPFNKKDVEQAAKNVDSTQQNTSSGSQVQGEARAQAEGLKETAKHNIPDETLEKKDKAKDKAKDKTKEYQDRSKNYLKGKMPKERREQTVYRLKKLIVEVQGHADYQRAIETLLRLAEEYTGHTKSIASQSQGAVKGAHTDNSLQKAEANLKTVLERFANGTSSDPFFEALDQIYKDADNDPELKGWFKAVDGYIRRALKEQGYVLSDDADDEANRLRDQGNYLLRNKYRAHTDRILDEVKFFANQFDEDAQNKKFGLSVQKLFRDLGNDENGRPTLKPHLWKDVTEVILPTFLENFNYIPIPRIEYSDPQVDLIVENLIVESDNLAPNVLAIDWDNSWKWGRKSIKSTRKNHLEIAVSGVQADLRDVNYHINRKQGFPSIKDTGIFDLFLADEGFSFTIGLITDNKPDGHFFKVDKVKVKVNNFNIKLRKSSHKFLFMLAKPLLLKVLRPALQKVMEKVIRDKAGELDQILYKVNKDAKQARRQAAENPDPENVKSVFQDYWSAYQRYLSDARKKAEQKKDKVKAKAENIQFNIAMTKQDSIFPNIDLPSGISTKATEYKDLANKGDRWESPIFSIGSASASSNIPSPPKIERKKAPSNHGSVDSSFGTTNTGLGHNTGLGTNTGLGSNTGYGGDGAGFSGGEKYGNNDGYAIGSPYGHAAGSTKPAPFNGHGVTNGQGYSNGGGFNNGSNGANPVQQQAPPQQQPFNPLNA